MLESQRMRKGDHRKLGRIEGGRTGEVGDLISVWQNVVVLALGSDRKRSASRL